MVEVAVASPPSATDVEQAKEDYRRSLDVLMADRRATELLNKQRLVGQCFKYVARTEDETTSWPVYVAAMGVDEATGKLAGWHFQHTTTGQLEIATDDDLQPGFLAERCAPVARNEFVTAFNELLTTIARFASRMPPV